MNFTYQDISEVLIGSQLTKVESFDFPPDQPLTDNQVKWLLNGTLVLPNAISDELIQEYRACWIRENHNPGGTRWGGWPDCTPYMRHDEIKNLALCSQISDSLKEIIGEEMGMHLNLTGWRTTERDFHQDIYLNPESVGSWYAAVWVALEDIEPDSGVFEYVPGSHLWPSIRRHLLFKYLPNEMQNDPKWPWLTQEKVASVCANEIERRGAFIEKHVPKKGDVLIWHAGLIHRGSKAEHPGAFRRAFIAHFSSINRRPDMPKAVQWKNGGWYFPIENSGPV